MQKMLVTGAGGMVGSYVSEVFPDWDLLLTDVVGGFIPLDVQDSLALAQALRSHRPEVVLHLAAATDVDRCQQDPAWAHASNALGTEHVARACREFGAKLVYASTGAVFSGDKSEPYTERDLPKPLNIYGISKWAGEEAAARSGSLFLIVRAGWMFGGAQKDKKFVGKIVRMLLDGKGAIRAVNDKWGTPTYAKDFLRGIRMLLERERSGLYHLGNNGCCTRYEIALVLRQIVKQADVSVVPVSSSSFPLPAPRGRQEALFNLRMEEEKLPAMRPWREALEEYVLTELVAAL